jgi:hypothetical protein
MASETDIANLALAHLGDDANVASFDPPEGSPQAEHCARFYPIARDTLLESFAWSFSTTTATLTPSSYAVDGWQSSYALPNGCLRPLLLYPPGGRRALETFTPFFRCFLDQPGLWTDPSPSQFDLETTPDGQAIILTNVDNAILRYTQKITDTSQFSPLFVDALGWLLASMLAGPVVKGDSGVTAGESCWKAFVARFGDAAMTDAHKSCSRITTTPAFIAGRL